MILRLVWRSLLFAPGRTLLMLGGYSLGVGVIVALLSIGDAMVEQSRDRDLVGGGDLAVLPAGIDLETLRTGGVSSLYFDLDLARFYYREVLAGPRLGGPAGAVAVAAPWLDDELLYARLPGLDSVVAVSAGGQIPSAAAALGVAPDLRAGSWTDAPADRDWMRPSPAERLREIDAFHAPPAEAEGDSTWAEWHYFNLVAPDGERWLYLTYLVGGDLRDGRWGGQLLATLIGPDGERAFEASFPGGEVDARPGRVDVALGTANTVRLVDGRYELSASLPAERGRPAFRLELTVEPEPRRYLPAVDISPGDFPSGYVVPVLRGTARGTICVGGRCEAWTPARAYHDHNWGTWGDVTWDWGQFQLGDLSIIYGGVNRDTARGAPASAAGSRFLFALDSLGLAGVLPIRRVDYELDADGRPRSMALEAGEGAHSLRLTARAAHVRATEAGAGADAGTGADAGAEAGADAGAGADAERTNLFFQMRGPARVEGRLPVGDVSAEGDGFFETWQRRGLSPAPP